MRSPSSHGPAGRWAGAPLALAALAGALLLPARTAAQGSSPAGSPPARPAPRATSLGQTLEQRWRWRDVQREDADRSFRGVSSLPGGALAVVDDQGLWTWDGRDWAHTHGSELLGGRPVSAIAPLGDGFLVSDHDHLWIVDPAADPTTRLLLEGSGPAPFTRPTRAPDGALHVGVGGDIVQVTPLGLETVRKGPPGAAHLYGLTYDRGGRAWCASEAGIHRLDGDRWVSEYAPSPNKPNVRFDQILVLPDGIVFLPSVFSSRQNGLLWDGERLHELEPADAAGVTRDALATPAGEVLVAIGHSGLRLLRDGRWSRPRLPPWFEEVLVTMALTDEGRLAAVTRKGSLLLHDHTSARWEVVDDFPAALSPIINTLKPSGRGGFWLGTNEGIARYHDGAFHEVCLQAGDDGPSLFGITALHEDASGALWVGAGGDLDGVLRYDRGHWELVAFPDSVGSVGVHAIDRAPDGTLWFSLLSLIEEDWGRGGLLALRDDHWEVQTWSDGEPMGRAYGVTYDQTGNAWVGQIGELGRLGPEGWQRIPGVPFHDGSKGTFSMFSDSRGTLWAGHSVWDVGVARLPAGSPPTAWEELTGPVWRRAGAGDFAETPDGRLWMASDVGLFQVREGACLEVSTDGVLTDNAFWPLLVDPQGDGLWIGTFGSGLLRLRPDDMEPPETRLVGVPMHPTGGAAHGVRRIRWRTVDAWAASPPESLRHRYRIDDGDWTAWSAAGAEPTLLTGDLEQGPHDVWIQGLDADGNQEPEPLHVRFSVPPPDASPWSQPPMVVAATLLLASVASLGWVVVRRRREVRVEVRARNELTARLRELADRLLSTRDEERLSLSRDLHDDLGQLLTATCMHLEHATSTGPGEQHESALARAHAAAVKSLHSMRELVARVRPPAIEHMGLEGAVRGAIEDFGASTGLTVSSELQLEGVEVPRSAAESIWRILKEGLTNVARHAEAERIEVFLAATPEALILRLSDDGRGFRPTRRPAAGVGLLGMRERAESLGGSFDLDSRPGAGTQLSVSIPIEHEADDEEGRGT